MAKVSDSEALNYCLIRDQTTLAGEVVPYTFFFAD